MTDSRPIIDWTKLNTLLHDKYKDTMSGENESIRDALLNIENLDWIDQSGAVTDAYDVFAKEVNRLELAINLFENLLMFEDIRFEKDGIGDFIIDIPREYFRFPSRNNSRDMLSFREFSQSEADKIDTIIHESRDTMKLRNDDNIVRELFHRLEFLALFSYFESYLESLLSNSIGSGSDEEKTKANRTIMRNSLPEALMIVISELNPEIENLLLTINPDIFRFLHYSYLVRNAHTHNLGKATDYLIKKGMEFGSLCEGEIYNIDDKCTQPVIITAFGGLAKSAIEKGSYIELRSLVAMFRSYTKDIAYILDKCI